MRRILSQLVCGLLLFCMVTNISGLFLVFCCQQQELKREMKQYLSLHPQSPDITIISFSIQEQRLLEWEGADEFSLHNQMYDVIKKVQQGNKLVVYCVPDAKESALIKNFLQQTEKRPVKGKAAVLTQLLSGPYVLTERYIPLLFASSILLHKVDYTFFLPYTEQVILTPPPRIVS